MSLKIFKDDIAGMKLLCVGRPIITVKNIVRLLCTIPTQIIRKLLS